MSDQHLDAKGLKCPLPVLKAGKAMKALQSGAILRGERRRLPLRPAQGVTGMPVANAGLAQYH